MKNIMFDCDGTLFDTYEGVSKSVLYALEKMGEPALPPEALRKFIGPPLISGFMDFAGFSEEKSETAVAIYREFYNPKGVFMAEPYPGIKELLTDLKNAGKKLYIVSSKPSVFVEKLLKNHGIYDLFDDMAELRFDNCEVSKCDLILSIVNKHGLDKSETIMIGDRCFDIDGAKEAGVKSIGVTFGFGTKDELMKSGATYIADTADEIKNYI